MFTKSTRFKLPLFCIFLPALCLAGCAQPPVRMAAAPSGQAPGGQAAQNTPEPAENESALAFPGAEGFGKYTTGGRGGSVFMVTNLNDNGPGSLREAIRKKGPRLIVFNIAGTIALESPLDINNGDLTIAGQSAPGDGICLKNYPVSVKADNVIIRYLRFRLGDEKGQQADAVGANKGNRNIIIDHCSMSWATDECASFYRNKDFTLQWCLVAESLNKSVHEKGDHGYGGIWGGEGASFHHNLIASHNSRMPRFSGSTTTPNSPAELVDFRNNVIFNWGENNIYGGEKGRYNVVNNYFKPGPATQKSKINRLVNPSRPYGNFYVAGNFTEGNTGVSRNNWAGGVQCAHPDSVKAAQPYEVAAILPQTAEQAYTLVLQGAGASYKRDAVDARIVASVRSGNPAAGKNKNGLIDSQQEAGGWPALKTGPVPADQDRDGMPDAWEKQQGLNPQDAADAKDIKLHQYYTNIEVYLNSLTGVN